MEYLSQFNTAILLNRLLRRSTVNKMVGFLWYALLITMAVYGVRLVMEAGSSMYQRSQSIAAMQEEIRNRTAAIPVKNDARKSTVNYKDLASKSAFGQLGTRQETAPAAPAKPVSNLALDLIGTFISKGQAPYAIIEDTKKKEQDSFGINDMVFGEAKLVSILPDQVEIERDGKREILKIDDVSESEAAPKGGVAEVDTDSFVVDEGEINTALENLPLLLTQARAVPYFKEGRSIGLRLFAIRTGSIFEKIGLKNGDILKSVNGTSLGDLSQAMKLFEKLKQERSVSVSLERDRVDREFKYQIR